MKRITQILFIVTGSLLVVLGVLGIFLPLLPTTPFLLLGATCYIKGSQKLYDWLIKNKYLGNYIKNYREGKGIPRATKIWTITLLWITIGSSALFTVSVFWLKIVLFIVAIGVTAHLLSFKTLIKENLTKED